MDKPFPKIRAFFALLCIAVGLTTICCEHGDAPTDRSFSIVAYLPEWRYEGANWQVMSRYTSHLILFSLEMKLNGQITALDRLPRQELMEQARVATREHGTKLMICFGGNGRSAGFSSMVRNPQARRRFVEELVALCDKYEFDGVDYNWEYPGYNMGRGYNEKTLVGDYEGLASLLRETQSAFQDSGRLISLAYYPDGRQEQLIAKYDFHQYVQLMHAMSYDHSGQQHSTFQHCSDAIQQAKSYHLPAEKMTVGLPFYGRSAETGEWKSYEDIVQQYAPLSPGVNEVGGQYYFNGPELISRKTTYALEQEIGGIMIWEVGQDCRLKAVTHGDTTHIATCPDGKDSSLLVAIDRAIQKWPNADRIEL
jgi:GH18 family chitinase